MAGEARKYLIIPLILCLFVPYELFSRYRYSPNMRPAAFPADKQPPPDAHAQPPAHVNSSIPPSVVGSMEEKSLERGPSILGEWLRSPEGSPPPPKNPINSSSYLLILVWKYGPFLERRHVNRQCTTGSNITSSSGSSSPACWWGDCSVKDCRLSYRDEDLVNADAVLFHLHLTKSVAEIPRKKGKAGQIWIFMTDESPLHTFLYNRPHDDRYDGGSPKLSDFNDLFDWSMTYRSDSDVPVAYGRTIRRRRHKKSTTSTSSSSGKKMSSRKWKLVAIMGSNCSSKNSRWKYARELKILLGDKFDIYGRCMGGNRTACPGHYHRDCPFLEAYKFYLAFENSNCREYITEKVYWHGYEKRSVPIVMGPPREDCRRLLPPHSFIHVDDFSTPRELANYLIYLDDNDAAYARYHQWRSRYIVLNEHGYFGSVSRHYCRICEALRYNIPPNRTAAAAAAAAATTTDNSTTTIHRHNDYRVIENYWNATRDCRIS